MPDPGFCINVLYVIFKTATGIYYRSAWLLSLGVYYLALAIMRFLLIHYIRFKKKTSDKNDELRRYRMCGCMLFPINVALVSIFSLETAMLAQFGSENIEYFRVIMTALTGTGVSLIVLGMAVFMIVRSGILIKRNTEDGK